MNKDRFFSLALQTFLKNTSDMVFFKDTNLVYIGGSQAFADMVGVSKPEDFVGKSDFDILPTELAIAYTSDDKQVFKNETSIINKIEPITDDDGQKRYSSTSKYLVRDEENNIIGIFGFARDVTAQMQLLSEVEQRKLSDQMFDDVFEADITENRLIRAEGTRLACCVSATACSTFTDAILKICTNHVHEDYRREFSDVFSVSNLFSQYSSGGKRFSQTLLVTFEEGVYRWVNITSRIYFSSVTGTLRLLMFVSDIDDDLRSRDHLRRVAQTDSLTGLLNRKSTIDKITECISGYGKDEKHALLFIDIDGFKQVNDNRGHFFGDEILIEAGRQLKSILRKGDIIGRIGGDEFLVLLKNVSSADDAKRLTDVIFDGISLHGEKTITITCSVGIALYNADGMAFDVLYRQADDAMYAAKQAGKNKAEVYGEI